MKQVKWLLGVLLGAVLASVWWAAAFLFKDCPPIWIFPIILTIIISIFAFVYVASNWDDE
jgi:hypothetical protein